MMRGIGMAMKMVMCDGMWWLKELELLCLTTTYYLRAVRYSTAIGEYFWIQVGMSTAQYNARQ
jgi:hypothetical protein